MAYVVGSARLTSAATATSVSDTGFVLSNGANRKVLVAVMQYDSANDGWTHNTPTFDGVNCTRMAPTSGDLVIRTTQNRLSLWYIDEADLPAAGTYTVTCPLTAGTAETTVVAVAMVVWEHTGRLAGAASDWETDSYQGRTTTSNEITPTGTDDIIVVGVTGASTGSAAPDTTDYTAVERIDATFLSASKAFLSTGFCWRCRTNVEIFRPVYRRYTSSWSEFNLL
jgi:hypothetical protein